MRRKVVVTSIGIICSMGSGRKEIIENFLNEKNCFQPWSMDPSYIVAPVHGFDLGRHTGKFKYKRYLNRGAGFSVASALEAVNQSRPGREILSRTGLFSGAGPNMDIGGEVPEISKGKIEEESLKALWLLCFLPNTAASAISVLAGIHGENTTVSAACSSSLQAIGEAFRRVRGGEMATALAGGGDSRLSSGGLMAYSKANALHRHGDYAPFDENRKGFVPGEGGAYLMLEDADHAKSRGAEIFGEIMGFSSSMDGFAMTAPRPDGKWAKQAVTGAMTDAGLKPEAIDLIFAHGTGTKLNDRMESDLIAGLFGNKVFVTALKSWIGHLSSACGAVETALAFFLINSGFIPGIQNLMTPCNKEINYLVSPIEKNIETAMVQSFGFGGQNSAMVIRKWK